MRTSERRDVLRLLLFGLALAAFGALSFVTNPPVTGDAYEYAGVARELVRTGTLTETHLRGYHFSDPRPMQLPHAAAHRGNLQAVLLAPAWALFGNHWATLVVPHLAALALLPLVLYLGLHPLVGRRVAFTSAWLTPLLPRVLFFGTFEDPGLADWPSWLGVALVPGLLWRRRWVWAGLVAGIATLFKASAVLLGPAWLLWALVWRRDLLRDLRWLLFPAVFLATLVPYGARNFVAFGTPVYSEDGADRWFAEPTEKTISLEHMLEPLPGGPFRPDEVDDPAPAELPFTTNIRTLLMGRSSDNGFYVGFPELMGWPLVPFLLVGLVGAVRSPRRALLATHLGMHLAVFVLVVFAEDRYAFPVLGHAVALALGGLERVARWLRFDRRRVLTLLLLVEIVPMGLRGAERIAKAEGREMMTELTAIAEVVRAETGPHDVLMTVPFWSPHFLFDRYAVPVPWSDVATLRRIVGHFDAVALLLDHRMLPDEMPDLPGTRSVAHGRYLSLRMLDPEALAAPMAISVDTLHPLRALHDGRVSFPVYPSFPMTLSRIIGSPIASALLCMALAFVWVLRPRGRRARVAVGTLLVLAVSVAEIVALSDAYGMISAHRWPRTSIAEAARALDVTVPVERPAHSEVSRVAPSRRSCSSSLDNAPCLVVVAPVDLRPLLDSAAAVHAARAEHVAARGRAAEQAAALVARGVVAVAVGDAVASLESHAPVW